MKTDNELIAEFMGAVFINDAPDVYPNGYYMWRDGEQLSMPHNSDEFNYNTSWDWLMPVIYKASVTAIKSEKTNMAAMALKLFAEYPVTHSIQTVYNGVVAWIKWYNENK